MPLRIEDLPFAERDPHELLGIVRGRAAPDLSGDFAEHGYATLDDVVLADASGGGRSVRNALLLALHSPDADDPLADPHELEVELLLPDPARPHADPTYVLVPMHRFLDVRAAAVIGDACDVILATCNPRDLQPASPRWLVGTRRLHFATGDVVSWLDHPPDGPERIRLQATSWHVMSAGLRSLPIT